MILKTLPCLLLLGASGCAFNSHHFEQIDPDGTRRRLDAKTYAYWPATTSIEKQRATLGKTFSLGTAGLQEDGGSTNITAALEALAGLVRALKP